MRRLLVSAVDMQPVAPCLRSHSCKAIATTAINGRLIWTCLREKVLTTEWSSCPHGRLVANRTDFTASLRPAYMRSKLQDDHDKKLRLDQDTA